MIPSRFGRLWFFTYYQPAVFRGMAHRTEWFSVRRPKAGGIGLRFALAGLVFGFKLDDAP